MSRPATVTLQPIVYNDTWRGLIDSSFFSDGTSFSSDLALVRMFFRDADGNLGLSLTSEDSTITITDAATWSFDVNAIDEFPLAVGIWYWSIETTDANDIRTTYVTGSIEVLDDATK